MEIGKKSPKMRKIFPQLNFFHGESHANIQRGGDVVYGPWFKYRIETEVTIKDTKRGEQSNNSLVY